jgi:hypothetical protein
MRRSGAFVLAVLFALWITPFVFAADESTSAAPDVTATAAPDAQPAAKADSASTDTKAAPAKKPAAPEQVFSINQVEVFWTGKAKPDAVFGYGTKTRDLGTVQFEHFSFHKWGEIYVDAEAYMGHQVGYPFSQGENWQSLLVFNPYFSPAKILGKKGIAIKPLRITDIQIVARFERESYPDATSSQGPGHFYTRNFGPDLIFNMPGFAWFETGVLERWDNINNKETWLWRSVALSKPWKIGNQKIYYNLLSLINGTRGNGTSIFERQDFLWEVPKFPHWQIGMRLEIENYKHDPIEAAFHGKDDDYTRVMPEAMVKYIF